jgi:predicted PurR-regulated permease PerM
MTGLRRFRQAPSPVVPKVLQRSATDSAGWPRQEPPWLRRGVFFVLAVVAGYQVALWLFGHLRGFLGLVFLAWLFAVSIEPVVDALVRRGLRRGPATGLVMFGLVAGAVGFLAVFGALLVDQLAQLVGALPDAVGDVVRWANRTFDTSFEPADIVASLQLTPQRIQQLLQDLTPGVVGILTSLAGLVFQALTFLIFAYYMSAQGPALRATVSSWFPPRQQRVIATVWEIAVEKTGGYVVSRLVLAALNAGATGVLLWAIGVPYWLPLAIWTGVVSQFIPTVGTYLAIALPALIALSDQPVDAVWVVLFGTLYQQVENYLIGPRITARTVAVHPAVAVGAVIAGAALFGAMGALVAIPVVAAVQAVIETYGHGYDLVEEEEAPTDSGPSAAAPGDSMTGGPAEGTAPDTAASA